MMRKRVPPPTVSSSSFSLLWLIWKLALVLSFIFLVIALVRIQFYYHDPSQQLPDDVDGVFQGNPRVAFMFLVRRDLPLDFLWQTFFENANAANYSIYIHSEPGFVFDETTTRSSYFYGRHLSNSIKVGWGESSMIEAERLLLRAALQNPANQRFILLSDSCVPLYNFSYIYNYLMGSSKSFVDSFLDMKEGRYNPRMSSVLPMRKWRKGSQWIALVRSHAKFVAYDDVIFPVFKKLCKRRPPLDASKGKPSSETIFFPTHRNHTFPATMAATTAILLLTISAAVINIYPVESAPHTGAPAPAADCSTVILNMADCLSYVTAGSTVKKPEGTCCSGLKTVLKTDAQCLCEAFKNSAQLGVSLNITKALALPSACHINAPSATNCGIGAGTGAAPAQAPIPMGVGMAPSGAAAFGPSMAVAPTPASQTSGSFGLAVSTVSVLLSMVLSAYFYSC